MFVFSTQSGYEKVQYSHDSRVTKTSRWVREGAEYYFADLSLKGKGSSQTCQHKKGIISGPFGGNLLCSMMISNYLFVNKLFVKREGGYNP